MDNEYSGVDYPSHLSVKDGKSSYVADDLYSHEQMRKETDDDRDCDWRNAIYNEFGYTSNHFEMKPLVQYDLGGLTGNQVNIKNTQAYTIIKFMLD